MIKAHSAEADVLATIEIFEGEFKKYLDLPKTIDELHEFCNNRKPEWLDNTGKFKWQGDKVVVGFGKNEGIPLKEITVNNPDFLRWMINASFPSDATDIAKMALTGKFPEKTIK